MSTNTDPSPWERSVQWRDDHLYLLDQTLLPGKVHWTELRTIEQVWESIRALKVRGAPAIGITAAFGLALWGNQYNGEDVSIFQQQLQKQRDYLASARPTAVNLFWALDRLLQTARKANTVDDIKRALVAEALLMQDEDERVCRQIGEHALELFQPGDRLLTHCNAGGLATARYGTALASFYIAAERGISLSVFACETRPVLQGARLTAWELMQSGTDVTLITDNMAAHVMKTKGINAVIVGTDRVAANGDVANKIGTYGLALLAKAHGIPFYVASPLSTIDLDVESGEAIPIEERASEEVTHLNGQRIAPEGVNVFNPAFDITPHELVTAIITEKGIVRGDYTNGLKSLLL